MSDEIDRDPETPTDPVASFFDLFETVKNAKDEISGSRADGRPKEVWVRWKSYPSEEDKPPIIEITACTVKKLDAPLEADEHEDSFT